MNKYGILLLLMVLFISCSKDTTNPVEQAQPNPNEVGSISFSMSLNNIQNQNKIRIDSVCVKLNGPMTVNKKLTISSDSTTANGTISNLVQGSYSLLVAMFSGVDTIAKGTGSATILPGKTTTATINMSFITGTLIINVNWPTGQAEILYSENFDTCTANKVPLGWTVTHSGDGASVVTNTQSFSAPNSFRIGCLPSWDGRYDYTFSSLSFTDSIVFLYKFKGDENTWFRPMAFINIGTKLMGMAFNTNTEKIQWVGSNNIEVSTITKGVWYSVRMAYKKASNSIDYYLNGNLEVSNCEPQTPSGNMVGSRIVLSSGNGGYGTIYFDDIAILAY